MCAVRGGSVKKTRNKDEQVGPLDVLSLWRPSEVLEMLVSSMMTGHDDGNHTDGPVEMGTWDVSREHLYGDARRWEVQTGHTMPKHVCNARCSVKLGRHVVVRSFEGRFHESQNCVLCVLLLSKWNFSKDCTMERSSALWHDGSSCTFLGMSWRNGLR